ncbi:hypothetical protein [Cohnella hashimotonis]|uniref:Uncharacterized protein n=1 Tax=Cohnella hashimotonis TaxID=2826895 RepID=A0ABT6TLX5_9BACL|nr:hypothetical protein [Cohnella hashimotonis]MDI4647848.1 hypothetical protein [Cohnella hashimotonis]
MNSRAVLRLIFFFVLIGVLFFEFVEYLSLVDLMGQYIVPYDPEAYLIKLLGLAVGSLFLNYLFCCIQSRNSLSEWIYLLLMGCMHVIFAVLVSLLGVWLFGDYKYAIVVYWGIDIIHLAIATLFFKRFGENWRQRALNQ